MLAPPEMDFAAFIRHMRRDKKVLEGKLRLVATEILSSVIPESSVLAWAASLASHSDHPVSKAVAEGLASDEATVRLLADLDAAVGIEVPRRKLSSLEKEGGAQHGKR